MQSNPKVAVRETLPKKLVDRMKVVAKRIKAGDDATTVESDDLIQFEGLWDCYGGLTSIDTGRFFFCFYPGGEDDETEWMLDLSQSEIAAIADGTITSISLWRCAKCDGPERLAAVDGYCKECDRP